MLISVLASGCALVLTRNTRRFLRTTKRVRGELVGYEWLHDDEGDWLQRPVFALPTSAGN